MSFYRFLQLHEKIVNSWHTCGRASMDPEFERMTEDRFDHTNAFKGMTGITNQYKKFIDNQIHNGCDNQKEQLHYVSFNSLLTKRQNEVEQNPKTKIKMNKIKLWARILRFKYCRFVDGSDDICRLDRLQTNPRHQED